MDAVGVLELEFDLPFIANAAPAPAATATRASTYHFTLLECGASAADGFVTVTVGSAIAGVSLFGPGLFEVELALGAN